VGYCVSHTASRALPCPCEPGGEKSGSGVSSVTAFLVGLMSRPASRGSRLQSVAAGSIPPNVIYLGVDSTRLYDIVVQPTTETEMDALYDYLNWAIQFGMAHGVNGLLSFALAIFVPFWAAYGLLHAVCVILEEMWNA
jgi:hypothetical protein